MTSTPNDSTDRRRPRRTPTFAQAALPVVLMLAIVIPGTVWLKLDAVVLLTMAAFCAGVVAWWLGVTWEEMLHGIRGKIDAAMPALLILISIGILIGTWTISGTIPLIVDYGLKVIDPNWIIVIAFVITMVVSTMTGTSWGSAGTVGVALIGIATGLGASLPMTAGAVVGGAYFGDKMSPLSDTTNLAPATAGSTLFEHIRHLFYTTIPAAVLSIAAYIVLGFNQGGASESGRGQATALIDTLEKSFTLNPVLLLPAAVVLIGALMKKPPLPTILVSSAIAAILALVVQGFSIDEVSAAAAEGFDVKMLAGQGIDPATLDATAETLLNRGGLSSMTSTVLIGLAAFAFAGILTEAQCLQVLMGRLLAQVRRTGGIILATATSSIGTAMATGSSYLTILIPGEAFRDVYPRRGLAPKNLSRTLEDSGTVFVPLLPWSEAGAYMTATLGVPVLDYAPWAFLCYLGVIIAIILGYTGIGIARITPTAPARDRSTAATA